VTEHCSHRLPSSAADLPLFLDAPDAAPAEALAYRRLGQAPTELPTPKPGQLCRPLKAPLLPAVLAGWGSRFGPGSLFSRRSSLLAASQTSESECYMRPGNSAILSSLILARQHAVIFAGRDVDVRERRPFQSADHDLAWLQIIEARLERHAVHCPLTTAASSSNRRSRRSKTHKEKVQ
jgi:hypothetical protein